MLESKENAFKKALSDVVLSVSPYTLSYVPYLETKAGKNSILRQYFTDAAYHSKLLETNKQEKRKSKTSRSISYETSQKKEPIHTANNYHPFISLAMTTPANDKKIESFIADFRARGAYLKLPTSNNQYNNEEQLTEEAIKVIDCLDVTHHQKLVVSLTNSLIDGETSNTCKGPYVDTIIFYGNGDISLGRYLEKYWFSPSFRCSADGCEKPSFKHVRRYLYHNSSLQVTIKKMNSAIESSPTGCISSQSVCGECGEVKYN